MPPQQKNDILQGTLALLVLKTLAANRWMHGYAITTHIQRVFAGLGIAIGVVLAGGLGLALRPFSLASAPSIRSLTPESLSSCC